MASKMIFLSHIHEEKKLALLVKDALEEEFGGFVDVFVSSDGTSIPAGANFLKRIEDGLADCVGAIYLISPASVKRNWINFELGAVWIRNVISIKDGLDEIPALPVCHSGATPGGLPAPLNNLNGILANQASQLENAFRSIQSAVGGRGPLRTDFDDLSTKISEFERHYTLGANAVKMISLLVQPELQPGLIQACEEDANGHIQIESSLSDDSLNTLRGLEDNELKGLIHIQFIKHTVYTGRTGLTNLSDIVVRVPCALVLEVKNLLDV